MNEIMNEDNLEDLTSEELEEQQEKATEIRDAMRTRAQYHVWDHRVNMIVQEIERRYQIAIFSMQHKENLRSILLEKGLLSEDGYYLNIDYSGPTEIAIHENCWELSFEGRTDEIAHKGKGFQSLVDLIKNMYNFDIKKIGKNKEGHVG